MVKQDKCFLVEGYTDVLSMHQAGIENVVASSGTALTHGQIRMIHRFTENITVLYDGDTAGINAALRGIDLLLEDGMNVKWSFFQKVKTLIHLPGNKMQIVFIDTFRRTRPIYSF